MVTLCNRGTRNSSSRGAEVVAAVVVVASGATKAGLPVALVAALIIQRTYRHRDMTGLGAWEP